MRQREIYESLNINYAKFKCRKYIQLWHSVVRALPQIDAYQVHLDHLICLELYP